LVEVIVALAIVGVLAATALTHLRSTRDTGVRKEAIEAAHSLEQSIDSYMRDHQGNVPLPGVWLAPPTLGPPDPMLRPYARGGVASTFTEGRSQFAFVTGGAAPHPTLPATAGVWVELLPPRQFRITVVTRLGDEWRTCQLGSSIDGSGQPAPDTC